MPIRSSRRHTVPTHQITLRYRPSAYYKRFQNGQRINEDSTEETDVEIGAKTASSSSSVSGSNSSSPRKRTRLCKTSGTSKRHRPKLTPFSDTYPVLFEGHPGHNLAVLRGFSLLEHPAGNRLAETQYIRNAGVIVETLKHYKRLLVMIASRTKVLIKEERKQQRLDKKITHVQQHNSNEQLSSDTSDYTDTIAQNCNAPPQYKSKTATNYELSSDKTPENQPQTKSPSQDSPGEPRVASNNSASTNVQLHHSSANPNPTAVAVVASSANPNSKKN